MLRIRNVFTGSRIRIFFHPDPGSRVKKIPGSASASQKISILTQKIVSKRSEIWSVMFIPDPDPVFLHIPDPVSRGQKGTESRLIWLPYFSIKKVWSVIRIQKLTDFSFSFYFQCFSIYKFFRHWYMFAESRDAGKLQGRSRKLIFLSVFRIRRIRMLLGLSEPYTNYLYGTGSFQQQAKNF